MQTAQRITLAIWFVLILTTNCLQGKFIEISDQELVARHDYSVVGKLTEIRKTAGLHGFVYAHAKLEVSDVIYGDVSVGNKLPVHWWINEGVVGTGDLANYTGEMIWFYNWNTNRAVVSHYGVRKLSERSSIEAAAENPVRIRYVSAKPGAYIVALGYQNCTSTPITLPEVRFTGTRLILPKGATINCRNYDDTKDLPQRPGSISTAAEDTTFTLMPGKTWYQNVDLGQIYIGVTEGVEVSWEIDGLGKSYGTWLWPPHDPTKRITPDDIGMEPNPLWFNLWIFFKHSPGREILLGFIITGLGIWIYKSIRRSANQG